MNKKQCLFIGVMLLMSFVALAQGANDGLPGGFTPEAFHVQI